MDQSVNPTPAPISARVTLPLPLLKNDFGEVALVAPGSCAAAGAGAAVASICRVAGDRRVSVEGAFGTAAGAAAQGVAAPSATPTHSADTAVRLINRLTCTSSVDVGLLLERTRYGMRAIAVPVSGHGLDLVTCSGKMPCRQVIGFE